MGCKDDDEEGFRRKKEDCIWRLDWMTSIFMTMKDPHCLLLGILN